MGDYQTVLDSFNESDLEQTLTRAVENLKEKSFEAILAQLETPLKKTLPCITDRYSLLRYLHYLVDDNLVSFDSFPSAQDDIHDIGEATLQHVRNLMFLRKNGDTLDLLDFARNTVDKVLALISIIQSSAPIDFHSLLDMTRKHPYIDSLVNHLVQTRAEPSTVNLLRDHLLSVQSSSDVMKFLFDMSAEGGMDIARVEELDEYLACEDLGVENLCALLRYIGERKETALLYRLHEMLNKPSLETSVLYTLVDVIAQLDQKESIGVLRFLTNERSPTMDEFMEASVGELEASKEVETKNTEGLTVIQCAFYGDLTKPGVSSGGGLSTFLTDLGNHLVDNEEIGQVYTFSLLSIEADTTEPLLENLSNGHTLIRIPVSFDIKDESVDFLQNEFEIMRAVKRTLERYRIDPDIFHIRYTDNASKAVASLAQKLDKKAIFTLTPDPHERFLETASHYRSMDEAELLRNLNKVFIADYLVDKVDGLLLIGFEGKNSRVLPYFPQLLLDTSIREKPLQIVAEGVRFEESCSQEPDNGVVPYLLTSHEGTYHIDPSFVHRPVILNVGRLHPLKGQHNLVRAWAESSVNKTYNLAIIGGNLADPSPTERSIIEDIEEVMADNPTLVGRFSHIPALANPDVRLLEGFIVCGIQDDLPNVYLCSSYKEEFGISILEGLAAGFLMVAPQRGGVSNYIQHGTNGFLIPTDDAESIRTHTEAILQGNMEPQILHEIALRGQRFARERFNISQVAREYRQYYATLSKH